MIGLIEIGNSVIKFTSYQNGNFPTPERLFYRSMNHTLLGEQLFTRFAIFNAIEQVYVASVAGAEINQLVDLQLSKLSVHRTSFIKSMAQFGEVQNCYAQPERLGVDRWLNLIAVKHHYKQAAIVLDVGTALTIDAISTTGQHLGGFITPGLALLRESLLAKTNFQFDSTNRPSDSWELGCNTESAVLRGTLYSIVAWIDRITANLNNTKSHEFIRVITGGDANELLPLLDSTQTEYISEPNLTFLGMLSVAKSEL